MGTEKNIICYWSCTQGSNTDLPQNFSTTISRILQNINIFVPKTHESYAITIFRCVSEASNYLEKKKFKTKMALPLMCYSKVEVMKTQSSQLHRCGQLPHERVKSEFIKILLLFLALCGVIEEMNF